MICAPTAPRHRPSEVRESAAARASEASARALANFPVRIVPR